MTIEIRRRTGRLASVALLLAATACAQEEGTEPVARWAEGRDDARFRGEIVHGPGDAPAEDALAGIWITLERPGEAPGRVGLVIWQSTEIVVRDANGDQRPGSLRDLREGRTIRAWTTDAEYLSIPPQYDATRIEVSAGG